MLIVRKPDPEPIAETIRAARADALIDAAEHLEMLARITTRCVAEGIMHAAAQLRHMAGKETSS